MLPLSDLSHWVLSAGRAGPSERSRWARGRAEVSGRKPWRSVLDAGALWSCPPLGAWPAPPVPGATSISCASRGRAALSLGGGERTASPAAPGPSVQPAGWLSSGRPRHLVAPGGGGRCSACFQGRVRVETFLKDGEVSYALRGGPFTEGTGEAPAGLGPVLSPCEFPGSRPVLRAGRGLPGGGGGGSEQRSTLSPLAWKGGSAPAWSGTHRGPWAAKRVFRVKFSPKGGLGMDGQVDGGGPGGASVIAFGVLPNSTVFCFCFYFSKSQVSSFILEF